MRKYFLLFFIVVTGVAGSLSAQDSKLFVTYLDVKGANRSLVITGYNGTAKTVVIPESIDGIPVRKIGDGAFKLKGLTEVSIPNGVEAIGDQAFFGNRLEMVVIPFSVKVISDSAFDSNMLRMITNGDAPVDAGKAGAADPNYPNTAGTVQSRPTIRYVAGKNLGHKGETPNAGGLLNYRNFYNPLTGFDGSYRPVSVSEKDTRAKAQTPPSDPRVPITKTYSGAAADPLIFIKKETEAYPPDGKVKNAAPPPDALPAGSVYTGKTVNVIITRRPNDGMPEGGIGKSAYRGRGLEFIVIPEGTTYIGEAAFYSNNLTSVRIPDSVRFIGSQAFMGNNLSSITIGENVTVQSDSFRYQFSDYYRMNAYKAGTYLLKAGHWNYEGNEKKPKFLDIR
ncbi:MAG: leucine-rich repeat domain-containing protein [Spirochaetaceae bacterium]|jgi:hypothetical protein|nr:leucine-rich repeat domain-containing protein [Spirochaetaceae bacterium]